MWGVQDNGRMPAKSLLKLLQKVQNQCLCKITKAYWRTPIAAIEKEIAIPPIQFHIKIIALQKAAKTVFNKKKRNWQRHLRVFEKH